MSEDVPGSRMICAKDMPCPKCKGRVFCGTYIYADGSEHQHLTHHNPTCLAYYTCKDFIAYLRECRYWPVKLFKELCEK